MGLVSSLWVSGALAGSGPKKQQARTECCSAHPDGIFHGDLHSQQVGAASTVGLGIQWQAERVCFLPSWDIQFSGGDGLVTRVSMYS